MEQEDFRTLENFLRSQGYVLATRQGIASNHQDFRPISYETGVLLGQPPPAGRWRWLIRIILAITCRPTLHPRQFLALVWQASSSGGFGQPVVLSLRVYHCQDAPVVEVERLVQKLKRRFPLWTVQTAIQENLPRVEKR